MVSVTLVTYNSERYLADCLNSVLSQDYSPIEILVVDNASGDRSRWILEQFADRIRITLNDQNVGFAAAQNQAIRATKGNWVLCLNPDVLLNSNFIGELVKQGSKDQKIGSACGKLIRWEQVPRERSVLDSTGIYFTESLRHFDRGANHPDDGQFDQSQFVFGATGAAALYRREMIEDVSVNGEFFDEDFFAFREDADLAWRAQLLGWKCLYAPTAVAKHVRQVTPERFKELPHAINWHSVKNRFLMRAKNISWGLYARVLLQTTFRDLQVIGYSLFVDRRFMSALTFLWKHRRRVADKRKWIQNRRRISDQDLRKWFSNTAMAFDVTND